MRFRSIVPRPPPRPAQRHFTRADQVNQLVTASEADPDLGFIARMMALCSLPRTNPGDRLQYKRVNGPYKGVSGWERPDSACGATDAPYAPENMRRTSLIMIALSLSFTTVILIATPASAVQLVATDPTMVLHLPDDNARSHSALHGESDHFTPVRSQGPQGRLKFIWHENASGELVCLLFLRSQLHISAFQKQFLLSVK